MILGQSCVQGSERIVSKVVGSKEHDSKIRKEFNNFPMNGILCQGVDMVTFIDCLIEQEGKAKER